MKHDYKIYMISFENNKHKGAYTCIHQDDPPESWQYNLVKAWLDKYATLPITPEASDFI